MRRVPFTVFQLGLIRYPCDSVIEPAELVDQFKLARCSTIPYLSLADFVDPFGA